MPEGDTIYRAAHRLDAALHGEQVTRFDLRVPRLASADLTGQVVHDVVPRGKHLLMRIGEFTLHSHLRMDGAWLLYRPGEKWRHPAFKVRAIIGTAAHEAVGVDIAEVKLVPTRNEGELVDHLGPDPLSDDWDLDEAIRRLSADTREIHVALLDQRNVAGFGNVYANELLFVRGIRPTTPATQVDAAKLIDTGLRMIRANRDRPHRTFTGEDRPGRRTWVYGRERQPCRRCGTAIEKTELGADPTAERIVFWCPRCQS